MKKIHGERQEQFKRECRLINLRYEYYGYAGKEKWAIVSELSEKEILKKYPEEIKDYAPFVLLSIEQGEAIGDFNRNEDKFRKRSVNNEDAYGYDEGLSECFHRELIAEDYWEKQERMDMQRQEATCLRKALSELTPKQRKRVMQHYVQGKSSRSIGREENVSYQVIDRSIHAAVKKMKKRFWREVAFDISNSK